MSDPALAHDGKDPPPASAPAGAADLDRVLGEARQRFVSAFDAQCDSLAPPADQAGVKPLPLTAAVALLHRMAGLGGTIGFPRVSAKAAELEEALDTGTMTRADLGAATAALRAAFNSDVAGPGPAAPALAPAAASMTVLLVEDEPVQRAIISAQLRALGHAPVAVATGEEVLEAARQARPDVVLLDIELPGINGYVVCQMLKADPDLAGIPVAFLSAHSTVDDRLTGLSLGADDFLTKPLDPRELALRLQRLGQRRPVERREGGAVLAYDAFHREASDALQREPCALALLRTPADRAFEVAVLAHKESRRRDICGQYDASHVLVLLPALDAAAAIDRMALLVESCRANGIVGVYAGVAASDRVGARTVAALMKEADEALAFARSRNQPAALRPDSARAAPVVGGGVEALVLVADDDPDVLRIVDAQLSDAGYRRILASDGSQALAELRAQHPDVMVLDLMMPWTSGFDVLAAMRDMGERRPRVIVLSARGREENVMRAFSLGADDFMLKPFSPQELLARVNRLLETSDRPSGSRATS